MKTQIHISVALLLINCGVGLAGITAGAPEFLTYGLDPPPLNIVSDASWLCSEVEQSDWQNMEFDDSGWVNTVAISYPYPPGGYIPGTLGQHIWSPGMYGTAFFRKAFTVPGVPETSQAIVRVDDCYDFYLNGVLVGSKHTVLPADAQTYDITSYLQEGENVFAIKGWDQSPTCIPCYKALLFDANVTFTVNSPPVASCQNVTVEADASCQATASIDGGSFDPDPGDVIATSQLPPGPYSLGDTVVTLTVTDSHGASSTCSATITVVDTTPPTVICPSDQVFNATAPWGATVNYLSATATDECGLVSVSYSQDSGTAFSIGTTTVLVIATDSADNQSACDFRITVKPALEQIVEEISYVNGLPIQAGNKTSLLAKLNAAKDALAKNKPAVACNLLEALIHEASAQWSKKLTPGQADQMVTDAVRIRNVIGCP